MAMVGMELSFGYTMFLASVKNKYFIGLFK
jgi:hypothetical protein